MDVKRYTTWNGYLLPSSKCESVGEEYVNLEDYAVLLDKLAKSMSTITRLRSKLHDKCEELSYHALTCANCNIADQLHSILIAQELQP